MTEKSHRAEECCHSDGHNHSGHGCSCHSDGHSGHHSHACGAKSFIAPAISFAMLVAGILMSYFNVVFFSSAAVEYAWYIVAFLPVGLPVIKEAVEGIVAGDYFNEFTLMVIACLGAFCIRELPEAVGVMLFYTVGETLQHAAVDRATRNISRLLDVRGEKARVIRDGKTLTVSPGIVGVGETIEVRPGERVPLDGVMEHGDGLFDSSALTGESVPRDIPEGGEVLAGMISLQNNVRLRVTREYGESALSRILELVGSASSRKARSELFIRRFTRVYTPIDIVLATQLVLIPAIVSLVYPGFHFVFSEWLYRALVFLVISCPCALVVSVPLGYFAGIGAASRLGILFKGGNYLEAITNVNTVAFDKTGTLTTGRFTVDTVESGMMDDREMLAAMAAAEAGSSHPLAKALCDYVASSGIAVPEAVKMSEKAGYGTVATVNGHSVMAGSLRMLRADGIEYPERLDRMDGTMIICAVDGNYAGYVTLADTIRPDAAETVASLGRLGIDRIVILSGDRTETVKKYADKLGIGAARGDLLPGDKAAYVEEIAATPGRCIAFVGDGMNDAPVLALSNVGVAMGGLGSDAAIESADVVIQTDRLSRLVTAIKIGRATRAVVTENIVGAIGFKLLILALGAMGYASLWAAVFADVGVALLAVLNSMRVMMKKY